MNFTCPYCGRHTTITSPNYYKNWEHIAITRSTFGEVGYGIISITCPNKDCNKLYLSARLTKAKYNAQTSRFVEAELLQDWKLLPESEAKYLPEFIPEAIIEDYYEACRIRDLSPKASSTLSRRCLQGMIRDFYQISKATLYEEINELEDKVPQDVWESIHAVREIGNIGAHMKKDINIIIDVEPDEAQLLIGLIEQLIEDWYVVREERKKRTENLKNLAASKKIPPISN